MSKKYHKGCVPVTPDDKASCGLNTSKVQFCEDLTDPELCVNGPTGYNIPHTNLTKPVGDKPGMFWPSQNFICNWDDTKKKCYLDTTCPCDCFRGEFDLNTSSTGEVECKDLTTQEVCELFYDSSGGGYYPCEWKRLGNFKGECRQGAMRCDLKDEKTSTQYQANTCTAWRGTTKSCQTICEEAITGKTTTATQLFEKKCKFGGYSRFCHCNYS